jgi:hypothetical protein
MQTGDLSTPKASNARTYLYRCTGSDRGQAGRPALTAISGSHLIFSRRQRRRVLLPAPHALLCPNWE